jgi:hypothetical protein
MKKDPHLHFWPSVTRCQICDKRVFVWQRKERRQFKLKTDNPNNLAVSCKASGVVHKNCKGNPTFEVSIR